jgi:hypothetical protein
LKNVSARDIRIYKKREKLEEEYKEKCGKLLKFIKDEKQKRWNQIEIKRRGGIKTLKQVMSERKFNKINPNYISKTPKTSLNTNSGRLKKNERSKSEQLKRGFHSIIQNPKKYFKDVVGEKKSIFAKDLINVKQLIEMNQKNLKKKKHSKLNKSLFLKKQFTHRSARNM